MSQSQASSLTPRRTASPPAAEGERPRRVDDQAIRSLATAIHGELRGSLGPADVVRLATALLDQVAEEVRERRTLPRG